VRLDEHSADLGAGALIRPLEAEDVPELFRLVDANREYLRAWLPWLDATQREEDLQAWATAEREKAAAGRAAQFVILDEGQIAGVIGFHEIDRSNRQVDLGYWVAEERQGRGLVTRAVRALLRIAFDDLNLKRVGIKTATENLRSRAIPERLGFRHVGVLPQAERLYDRVVDLDAYALLATEWRAENEPPRLRPHPRLRSPR
jgi:ribosomal-protein-serine acetyltransferase